MNTMKRFFAFLFDRKLDIDRDIATLTIVSTTLLILDAYHNFSGYKEIDRTILYLIAPLLVIWLVFRESPSAYGFQLGDWKAGLTITLGAILLLTPILWMAARADPQMKIYYQGWYNPMLPLAAVLELFGWEFFFRGWLLFGYARKFGDHALWLQAVPFALAHISKPELETLSTIFGGFLFGWVALRTKSFLYPFLIHVFVFTFVVFAVAGG